MQKRIQYRFYQKGVALLLTLLLVIVLMAMIIPTLLTPVDPDVKREQQTQAALQMAKQALLGHIARHYEKGISGTSGLSIRLPCPDMDTSGFYEGGAEGGCGSDNITVVGRFPWRSFDLDAVKDGYGECLWYVVSGNYKSQNDYKKSVVNEDTYGLIRMFSSDNLLAPQYGQTPPSRLVAAIISPGQPLSGEDRSADTSDKGVLACGGNYNPQNYLDAVAGFDNAYTPVTVGTVFDLVNFTPQSKAGNDRIFPVTRDEIMQVIQQRKDLENKQRNLVRELAECLRQYGLVSANKGRLPWPAPVDIVGSNNYADQENYNDSSGTYLGRFPYNIDDTKSEIGSLSEALLFKNNFCALKGNEELLKFYNDWKDHLFYAVSKAREPANTPSGGCGNCVTVNGQAAKYSALVIFAGKRLSPPPVSVPQQIRTVPPPLGATGDSNTRSSISNYLEGRNASNYPDNDGDKDYQHNTSVNDILFCVPADLSQNVVECPYETP